MVPDISVQPPSTPSRSSLQPLPLFSPRTPMQNPRSRVLTGQRSDAVPIRDITLASGCELIVRGVGADKVNSDPVAIVEAAIKSLQASYAHLASIPLVVKPFSSRGEWTTSCYVRLDVKATLDSNDTADSEPRYDLLEPWIDALTQYHSGWEVRWTPCKRGSDKRMWVRFTDLKENVEKPNFQQSAKEKLVSWAKSKGYPVCSSFANKGGITLSLACPQHVDTIIGMKNVSIPGFPEPLRVIRGRQIEILNAFELVIMGVPDDYEDFDILLQSWLYDNFALDGESTTAGIRTTPNEPEAFIFHMTTWCAASKVLSEAARKDFQSNFGGKYPTLVYPQTLHSVNSNGVWKTPGSLRNDFVKGADSMNDTVKALVRRIDEMEQKNQQQHHATHLQLAAVTTTLQSVTTTIASLEDRVVLTQRAILSQATEVGLNRNLADLKTNMATMQMKLFIETDPVRCEEGRKLLVEMEIREKDLQDQISASSRDFLSVVGGNLGQISASHQSHPLSFNPVPPGLPLPPSPHSNGGNKDITSRRPEDLQQSSSKRRRVESVIVDDEFDDTSGIAMYADPVVPNIHAQPVAPMVRRSIPSDKSMLMAAHNVNSDLMMPSKQPLPRTKGFFRGVFDSLRDLPRCHYSRPSFSCRSAQNVAPIVFNSSFFLAICLFLTLASMVQVVQASVPPSATSTFTTYSFNANGMVQPVKVNHFNAAVAARSPHAFVINETKTRSKLSRSLPYNEYDIYEEPGEQAEGHHIFKWGVIVGIRKDIQVAQRLEIRQKALKGRVVALDIVLPTADGRCFSHRFIGAYAPWNPGGDGDVQHFWSDLTSLCQSTTTSWTMAGDLNATIASFERISGGVEARRQYLRFLGDTDSIDLWSKYPDRSRIDDWTCKGHRNAAEGNIIDRAVTSQLSYVDSEITVADRSTDWIPYSDHRAIVATVTHAIPNTYAETTGNLESFLSSPRRAANRPRVKVPLKSEKHKYQDFRDQVDLRIKAKSIHERPVIDDDSFVRRYTEISDILTSTAANIFGLAKPFIKVKETVTNKAIKSLVCQLKQVGGAIRYEKSNRSVHVSLKAMKRYYDAAHELARLRSNLTILDLLAKSRKLLHKELFAARAKEVLLQAKQSERRQIAYALRSGSTKRLVQTYEYIPFPLAVNDLDDPGKLVCDPEGVKSITRDYFTRLYDHSGVPELPKPWLDTPSVKEVRQRVAADRFEWPRRALLADFRAMLRRGNNRPSPGPDQWEKWTIKSLSDDALCLILDLHNYEVSNSCFPGDIKDMWLTMFHKRGLRTNLLNWRGLLLSNFLANSPMTWLNTCLIRYAAEKNILPDTQVAAQPGVQTRDLMSFLASVTSGKYGKNLDGLYGLFDK